MRKILFLVVVEAMNEMLGEHCHLITMKGWRHGPGHGGNKQHPASPGVHAGGFHCDEMWLPPDLPEEVAAQVRKTPSRPRSWANFSLL